MSEFPFLPRISQPLRPKGTFKHGGGAQTQEEIKHVKAWLKWFNSKASERSVEEVVDEFEEILDKQSEVGYWQFENFLFHLFQRRFDRKFPDHQEQLNKKNEEIIKLHNKIWEIASKSASCSHDKKRLNKQLKEAQRLNKQLVLDNQILKRKIRKRK